MNDMPASISNADILVVDDTPDNIRLLSIMLLAQGYNVRKALNGQMALTAVKTVLPDLILLDISMPGLDGYEVCKLLKEDAQTCSAPVIFLSALDDVLDKVKAFRVGAVDYITKPFQVEEVLARIQTHLTIRDLQTQLQVQNTQVKQALSNLKNAQSQLVQKEKMAALGQLVAGVAHEVNNPTSFILGNIDPAREYIQSLLKLLDLYQQEYPNPTLTIQKVIQEIDLEFLVSDLQKLIQSMQTGAERIHTVIRALQTFSRLNGSDVKPVNIHEGIDSTLLLLQHRLKQEGKSPEIKVVRDYGNLPQVTCYASQVNQVFLNLLDNAIDALYLKISQVPPSSFTPTIWIGTELTTSETVKIGIKDNGVGMTEETQSSLFDPCFTTKHLGRGIGLGLLGIYQIVVEKHKGQLTCHSLLGEGTEFVMEIPVHLIVPQENT